MGGTMLLVGALLRLGARPRERGSAAPHAGPRRPAHAPSSLALRACGSASTGAPSAGRAPRGIAVYLDLLLPELEAAVTSSR